MKKGFGVFTALTAVAVAAMATPAGATVPADSAALRHFDGTVISKNREARTFRLRDDESGTVRIKVTRNTVFERINGFAGLRVGMRNVEATAKRRAGRWVAISVERSGRRGGGGGHDD
jgi:hypothetical protein